ncbi:MAG TPA: hypothetical protein EYO73_05500 [Sulfurimonas sp.]|nr:hypothetical protein [Sulfurimonas sp.]
MMLIQRYFIISLFLSAFIGMQAHASKCNEKLFTLSIEPNSSKPIILQNIINDLASSCHITLLYSDHLTKVKLKRELGVLYIEDFTLDEVLQLLLHEHNLFYEYNPRLSRLKISYIQTRSFNIDYINVTQMRTYSSRDVIFKRDSLGLYS